MNTTPAMPHAEPASLRPLNRISAVAKGGVPEARVRRVLADLVQALAPWHAEGRIHGGIAVSSVGLDASGKAHLMTAPLSPSANAEDAGRVEGYAAFEQYTDDPDWACGPWTDVYGLSALAHAMVLGVAPPSALARRVQDLAVPLAALRPAGYDLAFLQAVDLGLSLAPAARPATLEAFCDALGLTVPAISAPIVGATAGSTPVSASTLAAAAGSTPASASTLGAAADSRPAAAEVAVNVHDRARVDSIAAPAPAQQEPQPAATQVAAGADRAAASAELPPVAAAPARPRGARVPLLVLLGVLAAVSLGVYLWLQSAAPPSRPVEQIAMPVEGDAPVPEPPGLAQRQRNGGPDSASADTQAFTQTAHSGIAAPSASAGAAHSGVAAPSASAGAATLPATSATDSMSGDVSTGADGASAPAADGSGAGEPTSTSTTSIARQQAAPAEGASSVQNEAGAGDSVASAADDATQPASTGMVDGTTTPPVTLPESAAASADGALAATSDDTAPIKALPEAEAAEIKPPPAAQVAVPIRVQPWGEVIINGRSRGVSPPLGQVMLAPGTYNVTIRNPGAGDHRVTISVVPGGGASISHRFD